LVGDAADGYPGIPRCGAKTAATLITRYGHIEQFPDTALAGDRTRALLFKELATLRTDADLFPDVDQLRWRGPTAAFARVAERIGDARLTTRVRHLTKRDDR
jgi:5'-3' exonuclease